MPPEEQNKRKDNESQNTREYVQEHLQEHEVVQEEPTNINAEEVENEEMGAVQEKEMGGGVLSDLTTNGENGMGGGLGDVKKSEEESGMAGMSSMMGSTDLSGINTSGTGLNTSSTTEVNETVGNTPTKEATTTSGDGMANPDGDDTPLMGGGGNGGNMMMGEGSDLSNVNEENESSSQEMVSNQEEKKADEVEGMDKVVAIGSEGMTEAQAALQDIINGESPAVAEGGLSAATKGDDGSGTEETTGMGAAGGGTSDLTGATTGDGQDNGGGMAAATNEAVNEVNNLDAKKEETNTEGGLAASGGDTKSKGGGGLGGGGKGKAKSAQGPESEETTAALNELDLGELEGDVKNYEAEQEEPQFDRELLTSAKNDGEELGRTLGLGKKVTEKNGEFFFTDIPVEDGKTEAQAVREYVNKRREELLPKYEKHSELKTIFLNAYSEGYADGQRLKRELDIAAKQKAQNEDPEFQKGLEGGTKAGALAGSNDPEKKKKGRDDASAVYAKNDKGEYEKSESYRKGFLKGFNDSFEASQMAAIKKKQEAKAQLMSKPNYKAGYDLGHKIGIAEGRKIKLEGVENPKTIKNNAAANKGPDGQEMDSEGLYRQGFIAGLTNGLDQGQQALIAEKKKDKEDMKKKPNNPKFIFYTSGSLLGTLTALGTGENVTVNKVNAVEILSGKKDIASLGEGYPQLKPAVKEAVAKFYQDERHLTKDPVDKQLFRQSYIDAFNNAYTDVEYRRFEQKKKQSQNSEEYQKGYGIGETSGSAVYILQKFKKQKRALQAQIVVQTVSMNMPKVVELMAEIAILESKKIKPLTENLQKIEAAFKAPNLNPDYKKGYLDAYSDAYQKAQVEEQKAKESLRQNVGDADASSGEGKSFKSGYDTGKAIGAKIKVLLEKAEGNISLQGKIRGKAQEAYNNAKAKNDPAYLQGYMKGYNESVENTEEKNRGDSIAEADQGDANILQEIATKGRSNQDQSNLSGDAKTLANEFQPVNANEVTGGKEYLQKGFDYGYGGWYEFEKMPKDIRPSKTPEHKWDEKRGDKLIKSIGKETAKAEQPYDKPEQLAKVYTNGYLYGRYLGKKHGEYYLVGYQVGAGDLQESDEKANKYNNTLQYKQGLADGEKEAGFQDFRAAALKSGQFIQDYQHEETMNERLEGQEDDYKLGYRAAYNQWLKANLIQKGIKLPPSLEELEFEIPAPQQSEGKNQNGGGGLAGASSSVSTVESDIEIPDDNMLAAVFYLEKKDDLIKEFVKVYEANLRKIKYKEGANQITANTDNKELTTDEKTQLDAKVKEAIQTPVENYKAGLEKAIEDAAAKAAGLINKDQAYHHGVLIGYQSVPLVQTPSGMQTSFDAAKEKESFYNSDAAKSLRTDYQRGRIKGIQLGTLAVAGNITTMDLTAQLGSSATGEGYRKGVQDAQSDIEKYKEDLKNGVHFKAKNKKAEEDLPEDQRASYLKAYNYNFALGKTYEDGYHQGFFTATNDNVDDDYRLYNYQVPEEYEKFAEQLPARYQQGVVDGREAGFIEKYGGNPQSKELAFQRRMNQIRENDALGEVYADAYESGYREGVRLKNASGANIATIQMLLEQDGPETMAADFQTYFPDHLANILEAEKENLSEEDKNKTEFFEKLSEEVVEPALAILDQKNKTNKERLTAFKTRFLEETENLVLDKYSTEERNDLHQFKANLEKDLDKYLEGYIKGARKGTVEGVDLEKAEEAAEQIDVSANFQQQMMDAVMHQGNDHYIKGYQQAREIVLKLAKEQPDITTDQLASQRYKFAQIARQKIIMLMGDMSKEMMKRRPSPDDVDNYAHFREQNTGLLHLINNIPSTIELNIIERENQDEYILTKIDELFAEVDHWMQDFEKNVPIIPREGIDPTALKQIRLTAVEFLKEQYKDLWKPFIEHYRKGFNAGYSKGVNEVAEGRTDGGSASTGEATDLIDKIYEQLKAGEIEDGDVADLDWLSKQHLMLNEIYRERKQVELDDALIYDTDIVIFDLLDEVDTKELYKEELQGKLGSATSEEFMPLVEEMQLLDMEIEALEDEIDQEEGNLDEIFARIDSQAEEFRQFTRENMHFETPESSNETIREYLLKNERILELEGTFGDEEGNAEITGPGKLLFDDRALKWQAIGNIFLGLGDLELTSSGATVHHTQYFVELQAGEFKVPYYNENGRQEFKSLHENLELEMGIGMLSQIDQQLHLDEKLSAGAILMSDIMNWFGV